MRAVTPLIATAKRFGWGVADQALNSLTNFAIGIVVARTVGTRDFGLFNVVFVTYLVALGISRAMSTDPLVVRLSGISGTPFIRAARSATGTAVAVGCAMSLVCVVAAAILGGSFVTPFLMLALFLPFLTLQDGWRYVFFTQERGRSAFVNDLVWALVLLPALWVVVRAPDPSVAQLVAVWGLGATVAALVGMIQARTTPAVGLTREWWNRQKDLAGRFMGEFAAMSIGAQLTVYVVGFFAGLPAIGAIRAGYLILGPLNILFMGISIVAVPAAVRMLRRQPGEMMALSSRISIALGGITLVWGISGLLIPERWGELILGDVWISARSVLLPLTLAMTAAGVLSGALTGLRALEAARHSLRARIFLSCVTVFAAGAGAALGGAVPAAWGSAIGMWVGVIVWWQQLLSAYRSQYPEQDQRTAVTGPDPTVSPASIGEVL